MHNFVDFDDENGKSWYFLILRFVVMSGFLSFLQLAHYFLLIGHISSLFHHFYLLVWGSTDYWDRGLFMLLLVHCTVN